MKEIIEHILNEYASFYKMKSRKNPVVELLTKKLPQVIESIIMERDLYLVKGSVGNGNITQVPWVAVFDLTITTTAQKGFYPVYLFKNDMSGLYLSLNQGVTKIKNEFKKNANEVLRLRTNEFRDYLKKETAKFSINSIKLNDLKVANDALAKAYEAGNIVSKFYPINNIPSEEILREDLLEMLKIYKKLSTENFLVEEENDPEEDNFKGNEDKRNFRMHKRYDRNASLANKAKEFHKYVCKACEIDFSKKYGELGKNFIEAHHLVPFAKLKNEIVGLDFRKDFTVLCSNCHRMIHRMKDPSDLEGLRHIILKQKRLFDSVN